MSREYHYWTSDDDALFLRTLARHTTLPEALEEVSLLIGRRITRGAADARCATLQIGTAFQQIRRTPAQVNALLDRLQAARKTDPPPQGAPVSELEFEDDVTLRRPDNFEPEPPSAVSGMPVTGPHVVVVDDAPSEPRTLAAPPVDEVLHPVERAEQKEKKAREKKLQDEMVEELRDLRARYAFLDMIGRAHAPPHIIARERASGMREMVALVLASDWHVEETVDPASIAYVNAYNLEIAAQRIDRFFREIAWKIQHNRASAWVAIRSLVLWLGGDLITGYIHEELEESNALSPTQTVIWLVPRIVAGIRYLLDELGLEHIEVPCSFGNHGRTGKKKRVSTGYANSFEWLMYHQLAEIFRDEPRVHFEITPSGHQYVRVFDYLLHFHHGDDIKYKDGVGGLSIPLLKRVAKWDRVQRSDWHFIGHWHQLRDFDRAVVNGSLIGYNAFAQSIGADFEDPRQGFYLIDSKMGKCLTAPLWVAEGESHAAPKVAA